MTWILFITLTESLTPYYLLQVVKIVLKINSQTSFFVIEADLLKGQLCSN